MRVTGRTSKPSPYKASYFDAAWRVLLTAIAMLIVMGVASGMLNTQKQANPLKDPEYRHARELFNQSTGKEIFRD